MSFFLVTPYGADPLFDAKRRIVLKVVSPLALSVTFGPHGSQSGEDTSQTTTQLLCSVDFVVADLSYERPSCYFEVGYAQALGKPVRLLALEGTPIHQVEGRDSVEFYGNLGDYEALITNIVKAMVVGTSQNIE